MSSEAELQVIEKVQKLLSLAAKNPNQHEADAARAKAQELMTAYNLDVATIEQATGIKDGRREQLRVEGGFYEYQRDLRKAVAELNFCMYWTETYWVDATYKNAYSGQRMRKKRHRIVGRMVNTRISQTMSEHLEQAIERAVEEGLKGTEENRHSRYAHAFRVGAAEELVSRISDRYRKRLRAEKVAAAKAAKNAAAVAGKDASTSTAMTLTGLVQSETDANIDFVYGEGTAAKARADIARDAEEERRAADEYTKWAKANPEEARKEHEKWEKRQRRSRYRGGLDKYDRMDMGAYHRGRKAAESISIDTQVSGKKTAGLLK